MDWIDLVLHRDVYWLGRQWAVTGFGIQAVNKTHNMVFDVEASRIWQDGLEHQLSCEPWFDADDFKQALQIARKRSSDNPTIFQPPADNER